jgi:hypothetical protein
VAIPIGYLATQIPEWGELTLGIPLILLSYGAMIWYKGFTHEDRALFRMKDAAAPQPLH